MIELRKISKIYPGGRAAVKDLSLTVEEGETVVLIGSSGCGKTTTLKMINRLIEPSSGDIHIKGENVLKLNAVSLRREIGYVIQQIGLFPHMTIEQNVVLVPTLLGWSENQKHTRAHELMNLIGLAPDVYSDRFPRELSGGQQQRVGVARALAADPPILLMDEPFGALDPITRRDLQEEFLNLKRQIKKTIVFVTHDIIEAVTLGDRIAVMDEGELAQLGTPQEVLNSPADPKVEKIIGHQRFQLTLSSETVKKVVEDHSRTASSAILRKSVRSVSDLMREEEVSALPVLDEDQRPVAMITAESLAKEKGDAPVEKAVHKCPCSISNELSLLAALNLMIERNVEVIAVTDEAGKFLGVLNRKRLLQTINERFGLESSAIPSVNP